ncbi:MAG: glycosyltransferase family 2 protein [Chitinophagaceae bacterium]
MKPCISILIITYNRPADLLALLESIQEQGDSGWVKEILILNNASTVSYEAVESFLNAHPGLPVRYELSVENLGVSRGRNKLMLDATGDLLLVLDDDVVFQGTQNFSSIATIFERPLFQSSNCGLLTFRVLYYDNKEMQQTALPHKQFNEYRDQSEFLTSYFTGCAHLIRKQVIEKTGVYPSDFFYGMEEYDLSYRVIDAGYSIGYSSLVTIEHKESPLGRQPNFIKLASQWRNKSVVAWKYLPFRYFVSTALAWSWEYIRKAKGHWPTWFRTWGAILRIPFRVKRRTVSAASKEYLRKVNARLEY